MLEYHTDILTGRTQFAVTECRHILPVHDNLAARRPLQHIDTAHQGGLASPG